MVHDARVRDLLGLEDGRLLVLSDASDDSYNSCIGMHAQYSVWDLQTGECCDALTHYLQVDLLLADTRSGEVLAVAHKQDEYCMFDFHSSVLLIDTNTWTMWRQADLSWTYVRSFSLGYGAFVFGHKDGCSVLNTRNWKTAQRIIFGCGVAGVLVMPGTRTRVFVSTSTSRIVDCDLVVLVNENEEEM